MCVGVKEALQTRVYLGKEGREARGGEEQGREAGLTEHALCVNFLFSLFLTHRTETEGEGETPTTEGEF